VAAPPAPASLGIYSQKRRAAPLKETFGIVKKISRVLPDHREPREKNLNDFKKRRGEPSELVASVPSRDGTERLETDKGINCGGGKGGIPPQRQEEIKQIKGRRETAEGFCFLFLAVVETVKSN